MNENSKLLNLAKRVQALAENGLHYAEVPYDLDRYRELEAISREMMHLLTGIPVERINEITAERNGYRTPKVDVRAVLFNPGGQILMVKERIDHCWSLPGGWCDVGYTPREVAEKETREEAGIKAKAVRILAVFDKKKHPHPDDLYYAYKIFLECEADDFRGSSGMETLDVDFFSLENLPELSTPRNTREQIELMFEFHRGNLAWPLCD